MRASDMAGRAVAAALILTLGLVQLPGGKGFAGELPAPSGPDDVFLAYHEKSFEAAVEFDRAMLQSLGSHEIELSYEKWPKAHRFAGPRLVDVLAAAGAAGRAITVSALDGYAKEISADELADHDWIVALERDGRPLAIGGPGPLWIVYAVPGKAASEDDEARWPWAVFYIEVH